MGGEINEVGETKNRSRLDMLFAASQEELHAIVQVLLDHDPTRKKHAEIVSELLLLPDTHVNALTRDHKTAFDIAENLPFLEETAGIKECLSRHDAVIDNDLNQTHDKLPKTVIKIKKKVHTLLELTRKTNKNTHGANEIRKLYREGINNTTHSVTVVAMLFVMMTFFANLRIPGGHGNNGVAVAVHTTSFKMLPIFQAMAFFSSLVLMMLQITLFHDKMKSDRRIVGVISMLMCLAFVCILVAYIASSWIIVGQHLQWMGILVTVFGSIIVGGILGTMTYIMVRLMQTCELRKKENSSRRSAKSSSCHFNYEINPMDAV